MSDAPRKVWLAPEDCQQCGCAWISTLDRSDKDTGGFTGYVHGDLHKAVKAENERLRKDLAEARRRRDEWRKKAEGYDAVRLALRKKVGSPWPPNMSRFMWAAIAADEKKRADDAEAENERLRAPVTMQDVRLLAGEGDLRPADILSAVNAVLRQRADLKGETP